MNVSKTYTRTQIVFTKPATKAGYVNSRVSMSLYSAHAAELGNSSDTTLLVRADGLTEDGETILGQEIEVYGSRAHTSFHKMQRDYREMGYSINHVAVTQYEGTFVA